MNLFLTGTAGRQAWDCDVKVLFGLGPKSKWPATGLGPFTIQGITCWLEPAGPRTTTMHWGKEVVVKSSKHRTFGICPACNATIPLGRMKQHARVHA